MRAKSVIDDSTLMESYDLSLEELQAIANTKAVGRAISREREHRLRSGISTRELAAKSYFKAPSVLDSIMMNEQSSSRARIESARELRVISTPENQSNPAVQNDRFVITINLGADHIEHFDKAIKIDVDDSPPDAQPKLSGQPKLIIDNEEKFDG